MSTQFNSYVIWGALLDYSETKAKFSKDDEDDLYDFFDPYMDSAFDKEVNPKDGLTCIYDGMSGKYIAIGHVIEKSSVYEGFPAPISIPTSAPSEGAALFELLKEIDYDPDELASNGKLGWYVITHYR